MSAQAAARIRAAPARVALLGTGTVGAAVLRRLSDASRIAWDERLALVHVANSRHALGGRFALPPQRLADHLRHHGAPSSLGAVDDALRGAGARIVIDATASDAVAARHAHWLGQGIHVVTACKLGQGGPLARWREIRAARARGGTVYGDSATVGAGLPLLASLRALTAGGERILGIAGLLSGSMAWLFRAYDGLRPFSRFVQEAREAGYTEPDPRDDLSGEDVRRKLLILARAAGVPLEAHDVEVESLVPEALAALPLSALDDALPQLDAPMRARFAAAYKDGARLHVVARLQDGRASVRLEALPHDDPLVGGAGADNRVAIRCDRYSERPLVIQGPGAGAEVTAAALLDDVLRIVRHCDD